MELADTLSCQGNGDYLRTGSNPVPHTILVQERKKDLSRVFFVVRAMKIITSILAVFDDFVKFGRLGG